MKIITAENWQEMDPMCEAFVALDTVNGQEQPFFPDYWLRIVFSPQIIDAVPEDIRKLFEVARGAMLYGYFYYPLFALGRDQLHRVADVALSTKYLAAGGEEKTKKGGFHTLKHKINWLHSKGHLNDDACNEWEWVRDVRNEGTHRDFAGTYPPGPAVDALEETADRINRLFE